MTPIYWWHVDIACWGSVFIAGSEELAESFRSHKANWEGCTARKVRLRAVTAEEAEALERLSASEFDRESGIVSYGDDRHVPADVVVLGYTPGSTNAERRGCICPRGDNAHGAGRGRYGAKTWIRNEKCPYHTSDATVPAPWKTEVPDV
jgi:hypothetical protein